MFEFSRFMTLQMVKIKRSLALILTMFAAGSALAADKENAWTYLENGTLRIGVDKTRGAAIGYFGLVKDKRNLLNHNDEGRSIQQSYYGDSDNSMWAKQPWRYNPIQGGSYKGEDAKTLEFRESANELYAKVEPLHWANAKPCPEAVMQEWITLGGTVAKIRMRMDYTGQSHKAVRHQEMPAMFVDFDLPHLIFERGGKLVRHAPVFLEKKGGLEKTTQTMAQGKRRHALLAATQ